MIKDNNIILWAGLLSLVISVIIGRYLTYTPISDFFEGLFTGLCVVFIITYLVKICNRK
jgi:hypothetical protein